MAHLSFVISIIILFLTFYSYAQQCEQSSDVTRFDCYPEDGGAQDKCLARNCCWRLPLQQTNSSRKHPSAFRDVNIPYCYYPKDFPTYTIQSTAQIDFGQRIQIKKSQTTYMPHDILNLTVDLIYETEQRFRIRIYDPMYTRYEVPLDVPVVKTKANMTDYDVQISQAPFAILVTRKSTGVTL
jgi:hypothetical protein